MQRGSLTRFWLSFAAAALLGMLPGAVSADKAKPEFDLSCRETPATPGEACTVKGKKGHGPIGEQPGTPSNMTNLRVFIVADADPASVPPHAHAEGDPMRDGTHCWVWTGAKWISIHC